MSPFATARDVSLSLWQSAVEQAATGERRAAPAGMGLTKADHDAEAMMSVATGIYVAAADPHDNAPEVTAIQRSGFAPGGGIADATRSQVELSALYHQLGEAIASNNTITERLLSRQIEDHPGIGVLDWAKALEEFIRYYKQRKGEPNYRSWKVEGKGDMNYSVIEWKLPASARVAIIADWGTGRAEAINVLKAACSLHPDVIIHLGDIYFSGLPEECHDNFLRIMRSHAVDRAGAPIPVFNMAGNHDYYSGGAGFLGLLDTLNAPPQRQAASYFCLRSEDGGWQFLAADTGYNDHIFSLKQLLNSTGPTLRPDEIAWHQHKLTDPAFNGRTILLTHHQAFSANERIGDPDGHDKDSVNQKLIGAFSDHLDRIPLWLWGHEHTMMVFEPFQGVRRGRCIGHGGVPMPSGSDPYSDPEYDVPLKDVRLGTQGRWYNHGFAFLSLHGKGSPANVDYYQVVEENTPAGYSMMTIYRETIQ
jgi:hypothetical protein